MVPDIFPSIVIYPPSLLPLILLCSTADEPMHLIHGKHLIKSIVFLFLFQIYVPLHGRRETKEKANGTMHNQFGIDTKHNQAEHAKQRTLIVRYVLTTFVMHLSCSGYYFSVHKLTWLKVCLPAKYSYFKP